MEALFVAVFGIVIFIATMFGIYTGTLLAAKSIEKQQVNEDSYEYTGEGPISAHMRNRDMPEEAASDDRVIRMRQGTDDSYRILKRRRDGAEDPVVATNETHEI